MSRSFVFTYAAWSTGLASIRLIWEGRLAQSIEISIDFFFFFCNKDMIYSELCYKYICIILRRFYFLENCRSFMTRQSIRSILARCLFKRILLFLLIFFICKNRENMRYIITLKQEPSQIKIWNVPIMTVIFFLEIFRKLLRYRVRTQPLATCTSYHYNSHTNVSFFCGFLAAYVF